MSEQKQTAILVPGEDRWIMGEGHHHVYRLPPPREPMSPRAFDGPERYTPEPEPTRCYGFAAPLGLLPPVWVACEAGDEGRCGRLLRVGEAVVVFLAWLGGLGDAR